MDLWIRSQDRMKICNAKVLSLDNDQTGIFCNSCEDSYVFAGKYKSKERALEVLNEIQDKMDKGSFAKVKNGSGETTSYVACPLITYEMPEE